MTAGIDDEHFARFVERLEELIANAPLGTMLYPRILQSYEAGSRQVSAIEAVRTIQGSIVGDVEQSGARPSMFETDAQTFVRHRELRQEIFGPSTVVVRCGSRGQLEDVARNLEGQLTATIHGTPAVSPIDAAD